MRRSEINRIIQEGMAFFDRMHFALPPFARFRQEDWEARRADCRELFDLGLGWDVTGFGLGEFERFGLLLFTLRNGRAGSQEYPKPYAEKIMMVRENQVTLRHFHWRKREDIINRGGGNLVLELFRADPAASKLAGGPFEIRVDGMVRRMRSGERLVLTPGERVCVEGIHAHRFCWEPGAVKLLVGEEAAGNGCDTDS